LKREDLILPLYYVKSSVLEDEAKRAGDDVAKVLHGRQYQDWRHLRHEPLTSAEVARSMEQLARRIADALDADAWSPPREAIVDARPGIGKTDAPQPSRRLKSPSPVTLEPGPANVAVGSQSVADLIDRRADEAGSPYKKAIICLKHRSNAEDLFDRAFSSGGDVLYVSVMSQSTLKTMKARLDACKATGTNYPCFDVAS